ncbi:hypothetical protein Dimus_023565 [Dionaea muscipula]
MEKHNKPKTKLFLSLPRAASAMSFKNPICNPGRDKQRSSVKQNIGFSGPITPEIARKKTKNATKSFDVVAQELTSPKVSCLGQIRLKHKKKTTTKKKNYNDHDHGGKSKEVMKIKAFTRPSIFSRPRKVEGKSRGKSGDEVVIEAPSLGKLNKYASGRETLGDFNWKTHITSIDNNGDYEEDDEVIIPYSAPILIGERGSVVPITDKKEINLWKRRTMISRPPPPPLQL